jgi:hypothetical protein
MAIRVPIISEFNDSGVKGAKASFERLKRDIAGAEGAMGKFSAAGRSAFTSLQGNIGTFAVAAGAAIAGFAIKGVDSFAKLALAAGKFSDSTGLTIESASRLMEAAGDIGIEVGTVEAALNKLNRAAASGAESFKLIGAEIAYTSGGARDVQQTFFNVIDALRGIQDPALRAKAATELLGRGWQSLSRLVMNGSADLKRAMEGVAEVKVFTEQDRQAAERYEKNIDDLKDSWHDLWLQIGQVLLQPVVWTMTAGSETLKTLGMVVDDVVTGFKDLFGIEEELMPQQEFLNRAWKEGYAAMRAGRTEIESTTYQLALQEEQLALAEQAWDDFKNALRLEDVMADAKAEVQGFNDKWAQAMADGTFNLLEFEDDLRGLKLYMYDFGQEVLATAKLVNQQQFRIFVDTGQIDRAIRLVDVLQAKLGYVRTRTGDYAVGQYGAMPLDNSTGGFWHEGKFYGPGSIDFSGFMADGGVVSGPTLAVIGEAGPEAVIPLDRLGTMGGVTVNVYGSVTTETDLIESIRQGLVNAQRNGSQLIYSN